MENLTTASHPSPAGSSFSPASSSTSTTYPLYDVFINHRGPDVKTSFAGHLYRRLLDNGKRVFLDQQEMKKGEKIRPQIENAIRGASVQIPIFSPNYARSNWCLDELVLMTESGAPILPIFFNVEPYVVRHNVESGKYAEDLRSLQEKTTRDPQTGEEKLRRYDSDTIEGWRKALSDVADINGFELKAFYGDEAELLDKVLHRVLEMVPEAPLDVDVALAVDVAKYPTGLGEKLKEFEETVLLHHEEQRVKTKVVLIVGAGGMGKTTLAKQFFNLRRSNYKESSFIFDVRETAASKSLISVQSQLLEDLKPKETKETKEETKETKETKINSIAQGTEILRQHLSSCHALIILDDVENADQLEALLPIKDILSPQSLILVTSRDMRVLRSSEESSVYRMKGLTARHSKELFCSWAFCQPLPPPEFEELVDRFVMACDGLPLSIKVFGSLVGGRNDTDYWEEVLDRLHETTPEILRRLRISYDSLDKVCQPIFLDIAGCFIGEDIGLARKIWGVVALQHLEDKCLLEVDSVNRIKMHDHIRDLGRTIAAEVSMHYVTNNIDDWLERSTSVMTEVRGINVNPTYKYTEVPWYRRWRDEVFRNCRRHLFNNFGRGGILNLQLVATEDIYLERILRRTRSRNLKWLRWYGCPYSCLPSFIPMENLKVLQVAGWNLNFLWKRQSQAPLELRQLNIRAPLSAFPKSIGELKCLEKIVLGCVTGVLLETLPKEFCDLQSLKYLELTTCLKLASLPDSFGKLTSLVHIDLTRADNLQMLPDSFGKLTRLKYLSLRSCHSLTISNATFGNISTLEYLNLSGCKKVKELPTQVAHQRHLKELILVGTDIKELPAGLVDLSELKILRVQGSFRVEFGNLRSLNTMNLRQLTQLRELDIDVCGIEYLPQDFAMLKSLEILRVRFCPLPELSFKKFEGETGESALNKLLSTDDKCMVRLRVLQLRGNEISEVAFPMGVSPNLQELTLASCSELRQIGALCGFRKLQTLVIRECREVKELPSFETLISLQYVTVENCDKIKCIQGLGQLTNLTFLTVSGCDEIEELPGVEHVVSLKGLYVRGCPKLKWGRGVLEQLQQRCEHRFDVAATVPAARTWTLTSDGQLVATSPFEISKSQEALTWAV